MLRLVKGKRYKVTYKPAGARKQRSIVAKYGGWNQFYSGTIWDCRPQFGDMVLRADELIEAEEVK